MASIRCLAPWLACAAIACRAPAEVATAETLAVPRAPTAVDAPPPEPERAFQVTIEQDGARIAVSDHAASLEAKPFAIAIRFREPDSVMVNASTSSRFFQAAKDGAPFDVSDGPSADDVFAPGHGFAEGDPSELALYVDGEGAHVWYFQSDSAHRCHEIIHDGRAVVCRRQVGRAVMGDPPPHDVPLATFRGRSVYLVFVAVTKGDAERKERERDFIELRFR